jgi:hypothetical protein
MLFCVLIAITTMKCALCVSQPALLARVFCLASRFDRPNHSMIVEGSDTFCLGCLLHIVIVITIRRSSRCS